MLNRIIAILTTICLVSSCSVQKRHYTKGYYVSGHRLFKHETKLGEGCAAVTEKRVNTNEAAIETTLSSKFVLAPRRISLPDSCDVLLMKDGSDQRVRVTEITPDGIKYKRCDFTDGPSYVCKKESVFMITYAGGRKEIIQSAANSGTSNMPDSKPTQVKSNQKQTRVMSPGALPSLFLGLGSALVPYFWLIFFAAGTFGFPFGMAAISLLLAIVSVFTGNFALAQQRKYPENLKGRGSAITGITISWIMITIFSTILLIMLALI